MIGSNLRHIIDNLEEAIITKSKNGIGLCNKLGFKILNDIYHDQANEDYLKFRPNIYGRIDDESQVKLKNLQRYEKTILEVKFLKLH